MQAKFAHTFRLVGITLGVTLLISLIVLIAGIVFKWNTPVQFSNGFFTAGAISIVIGLLMSIGGEQQRGDFSLLYAETTSPTSISERTQRLLADVNQRYGMLIWLSSTGLLLCGIAIAISALF